ncbi:MAG: M28 family peptidase, partial [Gemmatimonadota bacterium]
TGALAALILCGATVGRNSPGAADNASGVATVMAAASLMPDGFPLGVLLTSAEELALAGALAWATSEGGRASKTRSGIAINIDTVDDHGELRCMTHGRRSSALAQHVRRSLAAAGRQLRVHPLLPGVLTDGVALAQNEWSVVTLSRGNLRTLGRIHRPADSVRSIGGDGAGELARLLAHFLTGAGDPAS